MIPIPTHLREMAENADGHGEKLRFFLRCPCGETLFSLEESNLSPKEKAAERAHEKAVKTLLSDCPYGLSLTYDGENFHYWKHLSEAKEHGEKEEIPVPPGPQFTLHTVVRCRCSSCGRSSVLFDSRLHGYDAVTAGSIIAMGGLLGMIAPPVNTAALIICAGIDVPYVGFTGPLLLLTFPLAIVIVLLLGLRKVKNLDYEKLKPALAKQDEIRKQYGFKIYLPFIALVVLMIFFKVLKLTEDLGMPVIFLLSAAVGLFTGKKINVLKTVPEAIRTATPVMAILMGVGMFIEVMTATGVRGLIARCPPSAPAPCWACPSRISTPPSWAGTPWWFWPPSV